MSDAELQVMCQRAGQAFKDVRFAAWYGRDVRALVAEVDRLRVTAAEVADVLAEGPVSLTDQHRLSARLRQDPGGPTGSCGMLTAGADSGSGRRGGRLPAP